MCILCCSYYCFFFFKQKTAYEMRISDWSSDVCSSDLIGFHQIPDRDTVTIDAPGDRRADLRVLEIEPGALQGGPGANELGLGSEIVVLPLVHGAQRAVAARGQVAGAPQSLLGLVALGPGDLPVRLRLGTGRASWRASV